MKVLVTGASGFIGRAFLTSISTNHRVEGVIRKSSNAANGHLTLHEVNDLGDDVGLGKALVEQDVVVHAAGMAHFQGILNPQIESDIRRINIDEMLFFVKQCIASSIKRFIFISSANVSISESCAENLCSDLTCIIKKEAEVKLLALAKSSNMEVVIIRSPIVYGPNAPGNFGALKKLVLGGLPLPLGAIGNQRSLVALDNLVDLIITCIDHPAAANQTFLVSDDDDVSTTELLQRMAQAFGKKQWLVPVPKALMMFSGKLLGKQASVERLFGSLQVDITHTKNTLGWIPPVTMEHQLRKIADSSSNK